MESDRNRLYRPTDAWIQRKKQMNEKSNQNPSIMLPHRYWCVCQMCVCQSKNSASYVCGGSLFNHVFYFLVAPFKSEVTVDATSWHKRCWRVPITKSSSDDETRFIQREKFSFFLYIRHCLCILFPTVRAFRNFIICFELFY